MTLVRMVLFAIIFPACALAQSPPTPCQTSSTTSDCTSAAHELELKFALPATAVANARLTSANVAHLDLEENLLASGTVHKKQGFHWKRALFESFTFFAIEQAYVVHDDYRWVTSENGIPFNH